MSHTTALTNLNETFHSPAPQSGREWQEAECKWKWGENILPSAINTKTSSHCRVGDHACRIEKGNAVWVCSAQGYGIQRKAASFGVGRLQTCDMEARRSFPSFTSNKQKKRPDITETSRWKYKCRIEQYLIGDLFSRGVLSYPLGAMRWLGLVRSAAPSPLRLLLLTSRRADVCGRKSAAGRGKKITRCSLRQRDARTLTAEPPRLLHVNSFSLHLLVLFAAGSCGARWQHSRTTCSRFLGLFKKRHGVLRWIIYCTALTKRTGPRKNIKVLWIVPYS